METNNGVQLGSVKEVTSISPALFRGEQVGTIAPGLGESLLAAPFGHFRVVAADQHFGNGPSAEVRWSSVVGKIKERVRRAGRALARKERRFGEFVGLCRKGFVL